MSGKKTMAALSVLIFSSIIVCSPAFTGTNQQFNPGQDSGFYYIVKKGDTLWDLSERFYHSQWDWPGLWEMNKDIKNPHWIYPGDKIQVFLKETSPFIPTVETIPKISKTRLPDKITPVFSFSDIDHVGFIKNQPEPSLGKIIKEQDDHLMITANDIVYIKPSDNGALVVGKTYQVFSFSRVEEKTDKNLFKGIKHIIKARVKILDLKKEYAIGSVTHAYQPVSNNDLIMEVYHRDPVLTVDDNPAPIDARLICSEDNHLMINDHVIAFIDAGRERVKPGQIYTVFRKNDIKNNTNWSLEKKNLIQLETLESGKLIVLHTEQTASTVMILSSKYAILPNDMVN